VRSARADLLRTAIRSAELWGPIAARISRVSPILIPVEGRATLRASVLIIDGVEENKKEKHTVGTLEGKVAIVTGGAKGIGRAIAQRFGREGAAVAIVDVNADLAEEVAAQIVAEGGRAASLPYNLNELEGVPGLVEQVVTQFGTVDILVNNAHDMTENKGTVATTPRDTIERHMVASFYATLGLMQAAYPHLRGGGRIINFASAMGVQSTPGYLPYAVAKESIRALTRSAAREWGVDDITVNAICPIALTDGTREAMGDDDPGPLPTMAIRRMGTPERDIAPFVAFLAGEEAGYITGYTFNADGGYLMDAAR
jgi:NAD(P)-dependent dehydrogenase (short-subunit alcohol dehydrogenase family)